MPLTANRVTGGFTGGMSPSILAGTPGVYANANQPVPPSRRDSDILGTPPRARAQSRFGPAPQVTTFGPGVNTGAIPPGLLPFYFPPPGGPAPGPAPPPSPPPTAIDGGGRGGANYAGVLGPAISRLQGMATTAGMWNPATTGTLHQGWNPFPWVQGILGGLPREQQIQGNVNLLLGLAEQINPDMSANDWANLARDMAPGGSMAAQGRLAGIYT